jgi:2-dehydro-3-deoxygluconokinase
VDVVTFGESMVLLTPVDAGTLEAASCFYKGVAGAESNVAIALARLGHSVAWISRVGDDGFGRYILKTLRGEGVDVSGVEVDPERPTGIFFKERSPWYGVNVQYYRVHSAASHLTRESVRLDAYGNARFFLVTGITPALSEVNRETTLAALEDARRLGIDIVFDPNIRQKLWPLATALPTLRQMATFARIVVPGVDEGRLLADETEPEKIADWFLAQGAELVVVKLGPQGAYYRTRCEHGYVDGVRVREVDAVGAGDAFTAGLISGLLDELPLRKAVHRACALGALAVTSEGDYEMAPTRRELAAFLSGDRADVTR